ncbi:Arm DNA-binding domain-containing protein [Endozoicomonas sp. YOMI1]|uniref:Arm DNA-binding domain-containing protein n=1 Tax=Endozoicomonas sp. YOMI1 TaxID=2828739 RepID=UPI002148EEB9|nr:Arm DNA-binding domain-containing protein [Endozoicomonas sp. YOMI1]
MPQYSPTQIENMTIDGKKKSKISEPVGGKGEGTLVFKQQKSDVEAYYRYRDNGEDTTLFIGRYSRLGKTGLKLNEIRDKAREYARLRREIAPVDLKDHLKFEEARRLQEMEEQKRQAAIEASHGTLEDLCALYAASLHRRKASSARDVVWPAAEVLLCLFWQSS